MIFGSSIAKGPFIEMPKVYHKDPDNLECKQSQCMEKKDATYIQKLMLMQPMEWNENNWMIVILVPFYRPKSRMPNLDWQTFQISSENWRPSGPSGIYCAVTEEFCFEYGSTGMLRLSAAKLWYQINHSSNIAQHLWLCLWWTPWNYQDNYQALRVILLAGYTLCANWCKKGVKRWKTYKPRIVYRISFIIFVLFAKKFFRISHFVIDLSI